MTLCKNKIVIYTYKSRLIAVIILALFMVLHSNATSFAADKYPTPRGAVNDFANVIDSDNANRMETLAREVLQKTGTAIVVVTVSSIGNNEEVNTYANKLYNAWGIGKKGEDKGILIFVAVKERKIRIETGYGVEEILPDGLVGEIRDKYVVPELKKGNYSQGVYNAVYVCSTYIAKDSNVQLSGAQTPYQQKPRTEKKEIDTASVIVLIILFAIGCLSWLWWLLSGRGGGGDFGSGSNDGVSSSGGGCGFSGGFSSFGGGASGGGGAGGDF
jgi:uncharacterized protein